ncbi:peptidase [Sphingobium indicum IP26]|uniref:Peptidase n=1 Tax=Sphingobium indicum F2 TaxID=1450518 RepID=A0A8E0WRC8_9SPHN|nr:MULTISPECIES: M48 family metallopeptidase [Sphingobium]EPR17016.1 peptidase [Sphingobium indicum IP26]EQB06035.1 peptidase [Sphingobium sp. HDIP04]KER34822.1 peptidase [Sphingobium indicum F2]KER35002.1 peptidase [Sphingobium indicum F2]KER36025.1 peptidase [Sphingobium indicum F2]
MSDFRLWHYDGVTAVRRNVLLRPAGAGFVLEEPESGWTGLPADWSDLTVIGLHDDRSAYGHKAVPGWRLGFSGEAPPDIAAHLPKGERYGRWIDRFGLWPAAGIFTIAAALIVWGALEAPAVVAPLVPQSWENRMGDAMVGDFGGRFCRTPAGDAALRRLAAQVDPDGEARDIALANIPMVNAVTLPGGRIILFDGLIQQAKSADEVAGVLGHELGHVRHHDTMTGLIRQLGLSVVLGGAGGNAGNYLNGVLSLSYGRGAETAADGVAIEQMRAAGISPAATAAFFERIGGKEEGREARAMSWLSSHPLSAERRRRFTAAVKPGAAYRPALDQAQWQALRTSCASDPKVAKFWGRSF